MAVTIKEHKPSKTPNLRHFTVKIDNTYSVSTIVTSDEFAVNHWIIGITQRYHHQYSDNRLIVGVGVQWTPTSVSNNEMPRPAATLQLCVGSHCLIYHLHHSTSCPPELRDFLHNPHITFVAGLWNEMDALKLHNSEHHLTLQPNMPIDLHHRLVNDLGSSVEDCSVPTLANIVLGVDIMSDKPVMISDWEVEQLSHDQISYACVAASVSFEIGLLLNAWEFNPNFA